MTEPTKNMANKKGKKLNTISIRVETIDKHKITTFLSKVNKKTYGRRVKVSDLIKTLLNGIDDELIKKLQDQSLTNKDKIEIAFKDHVSKNGKISKEDFLYNQITELQRHKQSNQPPIRPENKES